jgi:hypothetical protein
MLVKYLYIKKEILIGMSLPSGKNHARSDHIPIGGSYQYVAKEGQELITYHD